MDILSECALPIASVLWRKRTGEWTRTVVCKATFDLVPGKTQLSTEQDLPNEEDNHWDDDPARGVHAPNDFAPFKARCDVLLVGNAFAPRGSRVQSLVARLVVGTIDKSIEVHGDRLMDKSGRLIPATPFANMPLRYERAAGGPGTWNPVGIVLAQRDERGIGRVPSLQAAGVPSTPDNVVPIGFGPIAPSWPQRRPLLPNGALLPRGWPGSGDPTPDAIDPRFFNVAPPDQQIEAIDLEQTISLENLHRDHPRLVTMLPGIAPRATLELPARGQKRDLPLIPDTLWIDTDRAICTLTFRGWVALTSREEAGRVVVHLEHRKGGGHRKPEDEDRGTKRYSGPALGPALPFNATSVSPLGQTAAPAPQAPLAPSRESDTPLVPLRSPVPAMTIGEAAMPSARREPIRLERPAIPESIVRAGLMAVSNAAADPGRRSDANETGSAASSSGPPVQLLWFEPSHLGAIRRKASFKTALTTVASRRRDEPVDDELRAQKKAMKDQRDVTAVLRLGESSDSKALAAALHSALDEGERLPLALVAGDLEIGFDELEELRAAIVVARPFIGGDKRLKEVIEALDEIVGHEGVDLASALPDGLLVKLREAFVTANRALPLDYLAARTERLLVQRRAYRKRTLLGVPLIRAEMGFGAGVVVPVYLPESLSLELPLFRAIPMRIIAEVQPRLDQYESAALALRAVALGRVHASASS